MRRTPGMLVLALTIGCGARSGLDVDPNDRDPASRDGGVITDSATNPADAPTNPGPRCSVVAASGRLMPLDVFMLFDASGSMAEETPSRLSKWDAVYVAIDRFFHAPESAGLGIALTFFPKVRYDVPVLCGGEVTCGEDMPCDIQHVCSATRSPCERDLDCLIAGIGGNRCVPLGFCADRGFHHTCFPDGGTPCPSGPCVPIGQCTDRDTCDTAAYETPSIGVVPLPDAADMLLRTYQESEVPQLEAGGTPTLSAVTGTLDGAVRYAADHPDRKVVVVIATDGLPTSCDPDLRFDVQQGIDNVAAVAGRGLDSGVETFVIGVFGSDEAELAQNSLDRIADAGGTNHAFIVNTASGVSDEFVDALSRVRLDAGGCELRLSEPVPRTGDRAWARVRQGDTTTWAEQVDDPASCGGGGFYFTGAGAADGLVLCPETCESLDGNLERRVDVLTACASDPSRESSSGG